MDRATEASAVAIASVRLPGSLSADAQAGEKGFDARCSRCHGKNAVGLERRAPPLVHKIYEPARHDDEPFQQAVAVRQHHWPFGDMPPVEGLSRGDVSMIVAYVRELQRANGTN